MEENISLLEIFSDLSPLFKQGGQKKFALHKGGEDTDVWHILGRWFFLPLPIHEQTRPKRPILNRVK